jgi:hypothetical protein
MKGLEFLRKRWWLSFIKEKGDIDSPQAPNWSLKDGPM